MPPRRTSRGYVFVGYDMHWPDASRNWEQAGPNAPTSKLREAIETTLNSCTADRVWLLLPWYGRSFTCDGEEEPVVGNCSCAEHNLKKKRFELLDAARFEGNCTGLWRAEDSVAYECTGNAGLPGMADARTQVWYDNTETLTIKYALKDEYGLGGLGIWTSSGAMDPSYAPGIEMWAALPR